MSKDELLNIYHHSKTYLMKTTKVETAYIMIQKIKR